MGGREERIVGWEMVMERNMELRQGEGSGMSEGGEKGGREGSFSFPPGLSLSPLLLATSLSLSFPYMNFHSSVCLFVSIIRP